MINPISPKIGKVPVGEHISEFVNLLLLLLGWKYDHISYEWGPSFLTSQDLLGRNEKVGGTNFSFVPGTSNPLYATVCA